MSSEAMLVDSKPATQLQPQVEEAEDEEEEGEEESKKEKESGEEGGGGGREGKGESQRKKASEKSELDSSRRPPRERKLVERYSIPFPSLGKSPPNKPLSIPKGSGSQLKDIPNVAFKLSKRKIDENLQLLHNILFGKKAKAHSLKRNIGQFSGFVWTENEEKQRSRVKDKLDKCTKEKLVDFCDVLNIPINKATVKKEELSAKLLVFLESPSATTDVLLSEKDQKSQKKRKHTPSKSPSSGEATETPAKKQKQAAKDGKKQRQPTDADNDSDMATHPEESQDDSGHHGNNKMVSVEESDHAGNRSQEEEDSQDKVPKDKSGKRVKKVTSKNNRDDIKPVKKAALEKPVKSSSKSSKKSSRKGAADADGSLGTPVKPKGSLSTKKAKKEEEGVTTNVKAKGKKKSVKSPEKLVVKDQGKGKTGKKAKAGPTREEMHAVVVNILKEVDFNTATLSDIIKLLGAHFGMELLHRKGEVKEIITDVINNMSDDEEEENAENIGTDDVAENNE